MIEYLLDTNSVSDIINRPRGSVARRAREAGSALIGISIIAAAEVRFGYHRKGVPRLTSAAEAIIDSLTILPFEAPADWRYAELRTALLRQGAPIGANDMLIAAHALVLDCVLVTDNVREFERVEGLRVENWLRD